MNVPDLVGHLRNKSVLLLDDFYPTTQCNAVESISAFVAREYECIPVEIPREDPGLHRSPIYYEPTERNWPALIIPDTGPDITAFVAREIEPRRAKIHGIVSSAFDGFRIDGEMRVLQLGFALVPGKTDENAVEGLGFPKDYVRLPPGAFVRHSK